VACFSSALSLRLRNASPPPQYHCFTTALLPLYYCFTTALLLFYYFYFTTGLCAQASLPQHGRKIYGSTGSQSPLDNATVGWRPRVRWSHIYTYIELCIYTYIHTLNHPWIARLLAEGLASAGLMYIYIYRFMWTHMYTYTQSPPDNASFGWRPRVRWAHI